MMEPSPQPPSESLHSDPPSGPLEKHFFCGDLSDLQGCPSRSTLFSTTPGKQNTLPGMTFLSVLIFYSTQLYWSLFLKKKKVKSLVSVFQEYSVLLIGREFPMILEREKGRVGCWLLNFLVS